jgi:hypothetical protein
MATTQTKLSIDPQAMRVACGEIRLEVQPLTKDLDEIEAACEKAEDFDQVEALKARKVEVARGCCKVARARTRQLSEGMEAVEPIISAAGPRFDEEEKVAKVAHEELLKENERRVRSSLAGIEAIQQGRTKLYSDYHAYNETAMAMQGELKQVINRCLGVL